MINVNSNIILEKEKKLISIIVPVYKVEQYLEKCLNSLVNQTYKNIEIIVVNDGSPDNSQKIIDEYQKKYPKLIKSYIKENGGLSDARNFGIKKSHGDYIAFVDSDDYVDTTMYEKLYNKAISHDFDLVVCNLNYVYPNQSKSCNCNIDCDIFTKEEIKNIMTIIYPAAWNKLYKKELLNEITFKKGIWYEDVEFLYRLFPRIKSIGVVDENLYQYVQREGAITSIFNEKIYDYIDNWNGIIDYYKKNDLFDEYKLELEYSYVRYLYATMVKGLLKWHNREKYDLGVQKAIDNVYANFPNYKKNKYIKKLNGKSLYLRYFNRSLANLMFKLKK